MDTNKAPTDLWGELSRHYMLARQLGEQPPEAFRAFIENLAAVLAEWLQCGQRKDEPDPLLEFSQLRVMADLFVGNKEKRDEGFSQTRSRLLSALDLWWETFKQDHDSEA